MEELNKVELSKPEFYGLMMIYAANIDGQEDETEVTMIRQSIGDECYERAYKIYDSMNDFDLINYFRDNKGKYFRSQMDEKIFLSEIKSVISADHEIDIMESTLLHAFRKLLKE